MCNVFSSLDKNGNMIAEAKKIRVFFRFAISRKERKERERGGGKQKN